jgi:hypothetical protein
VTLPPHKKKLKFGDMQRYICGFDVDNKKGKAIPVTGRGGPTGCEMSRLPHFYTVGSQMVERSSALYAGHLYSQEDIWYSFLLEADSTPGI